MITVHQLNHSPFNEKVTRQLNYKGIPFEERLWTLGEMKQVKRFNPTGKLPVLEHDGQFICDSTDIFYYVEQTFPEKPMIPDDRRLAGYMHAIEDWADESLYFYEMHLRLTTPGNAEKNIARLVEGENAFMRWLMPKIGAGTARKITRTQGLGKKPLDQILQDTDRHIHAIADMLGDDDWLLCEIPTIADLAVYGMLKALEDADMSLALIKKQPTVSAWMARLEKTTGAPAAG